MDLLPLPQDPVGVGNDRRPNSAAPCQIDTAGHLPPSMRAEASRIERPLVRPCRRVRRAFAETPPACWRRRRGVKQAGEDRSAGEHLRVGSQHGRGHRLAGREPGDEHAARGRRRSGRSSCRSSGRSTVELAGAPRRVAAGSNQLKHKLGLARPALQPGQQHRKAVRFRQLRPPGAGIVARRAVSGAAVERDDQRDAGPAGGNVEKRPQPAWIGPERFKFRAKCGCRARASGAACRETTEVKPRSCAFSLFLPGTTPREDH